MATISHSDLAPTEAVTYSLASAEPFTLEGVDATYEVAVPDEESGPLRAAYDTLISNANGHPWLTVEVPEAPVDADAEPLTVEWPRTAIDAGLDQKVADWEGDGGAVATAETLAADAAQGDEPVVVDDDDTDEDKD